MRPTPRHHLPCRDWDLLLEVLAPVDFLILEQVYVVDGEPVQLTALQQRLAYLNLSGRTISRHVDRLRDRGLVDVVFSCECLVNPIPAIHRDAALSVRIWRMRQERSLRTRSGPGVGDDACEVE